MSKSWTTADGDDSRRAWSSTAIRLGGRVIVGLIGGASLFVVGCSSKEGQVPVFPVRGQVSFKGEPTPGAFIVFHPSGSAADAPNKPTAQVKQDGSFQLTTFDEGDGAPAGEYAVTVQWNKLIVRGSDAQAGPNVIPAKFSKPETTPWKVKVDQAGKELPPFEITK